MNCWKLSVNKSQSEKFQEDPLMGWGWGIPHFCEFYLQKLNRFSQ